ncbi:transcriptional regulator [Gammaproteobacteria bacterium]|nr:transcriptional regulator [Gammaproteobacteria bacterium]
MYKKSGLSVIFLAKKLMALKQNERIATISEFAEEACLARGTIQNGLQFLKDQHAIVLEPRGHLGTFISQINYQLLWSLTEIGTLTGAMPLPYSKLYEGLATGIYAAAERFGLDMNIAYVSGARTRINLLIRGSYDYVITSALAAKTAKEEGLPIKVCLHFGKGSYLSEHVILFAHEGKSAIEDGMRVGVDQSSLDMQYLTTQICLGKDVQLINIPYNQIVKQIQQKSIDAGIWNYDEIKEKSLPINFAHLPINKIFLESSDAVVLIHDNQSGLFNLLQTILHKKTILECQSKVINAMLMPTY